MIPTIAFAGYSGSGKTTLIERLVRCYKAQGLRVGVVKHDAHRFEIDHEGKDSWRFAQAGADVTVLSSAEKTAVIEQRGLPFDRVLEKISDVDLILVEGYKTEPLPQIGLCRAANGKGFPADLTRYAAIVTDVELQAPCPRFGFDEIEKISDFILRYFAMK